MTAPQPDSTPYIAHQTLLAFDFGTKRIGVACGNTFLRQAQPLRTLANHGTQCFELIRLLIVEWRPDTLVVGVPFHPDGQPHDNTLKARKFGRQLAGRFKLPVVEVDERYTTTSAKMSGDDSHSLDAQAAAIILQQYFFDYCRPASTSP